MRHKKLLKVKTLFSFLGQPYMAFALTYQKLPDLSGGVDDLVVGDDQFSRLGPIEFENSKLGLGVVGPYQVESLKRK